MNLGPGLHAAPGRPVDAAAYERYLGRWSRLFVPAVLDAAGVADAQRVLDVATGPGEAAALALARVGPPGLVVGADVAVAMVEAAAARRRDPRLRLVAADGEALPFGAGAFDAVVCQLGLMFFRDPQRGLAEFRRVLRAGGRAAVCVVSTRERAPMWGVLAGALARRLPAERDVLYRSFALADADDIRRLFVGAGFADVQVVREVRDAHFASFEEYWVPIEAGAGSLPQAYRALPTASRDQVREEVRAGLAGFVSGGQLTTTLEMLVASGRA